MSGGDHDRWRESGLEITVEGHIARLRIARPEVRNALSIGLTHALVSALDALDRDDDVWLLSLTGAGDKAFCAGTDLKELDAIAEAGGEGFPLPMSGVERNLFEVLLETGKPTVAIINGAAMGAGCELALACDIRVMARHAVLAQAEAKRGMGANFGSVVLPRLIPRAIAFEMLYTGEPVGADAALHWGLVNRVAESADLEQAADDLVNAIIANAPLSLRRYKNTFTKSWGLPVHQALRLDASPSPYGSRDRIEGIRAFNEKRPPRWEGR